MHEPPQKPPDDLAEVERALSVLQGRHPEHERVRREDEAKRARRQAVIDTDAQYERGKTVRRRLVTIVVAGVLVSVVGVSAFFVQREASRRAGVDQALDPYRAMGYAVVDTSPPSARGRLQADTTAGCMLAVAVPGGTVHVEGGGTKVDGPSPALFCTCLNASLTVTADVGDRGGLALLRIDAATIGGSLAFATLPFKPATIAKTDEACDEQSFDAWLDTKHWPSVPPDEAWLGADPSRAPLKVAGFRVIATARRSVPFGVIAVPKDTCLLAVGTGKDTLRLRPRGGADPLTASGDALGWCGSAEGIVIVDRAGEGDVHVLAAKAGEVGGLLGVREVAKQVRMSMKGGMPPGDRAGDAKQLLLASSVPESLIRIASAPDVPPDVDARLVALSFGTPGALTPDPQPDVYSYCEPPLDEKTTESVCVFSGQHAWRVNGREAIGGIARAKLPFWLSALEGASDPLSLKVAADLIALARTLRHDGFEPTTIDALTELPTGVEILGRVNEDAVIAFALAATPPWIFPYTDGPAWTLGHAPRVVPVTPLQKVTLTSTTPKNLPPMATRHSVVFRRHKR